MPGINELPERFWKKVDRTGGPDACWPWLAATIVGYPACRDGLVRRYLWIKEYGTIPKNLRVCCQYDTILCVNPSHLVTRSASDRRELAKKRGTFYSPFIECSPEERREYQTTAKLVREALGHHHAFTLEERARGHITRGCIPGGTDQSKRSSFEMTRAERRELLKDPCVYCNNKATEVDHIQPFSRGGSHDSMNRAPTCLPCNRSKNDSGLLRFLVKRLVQQQDEAVAHGVLSAASQTSYAGH